MWDGKYIRWLPKQPEPGVIATKRWATLNRFTCGRDLWSGHTGGRDVLTGDHILQIESTKLKKG